MLKNGSSITCNRIIIKTKQSSVEKVIHIKMPRKYLRKSMECAFSTLKYTFEHQTFFFVLTKVIYIKKCLFKEFVLFTVTFQVVQETFQIMTTIG